MGLREEMNADIDTQAPVKAAEAVARKRAPKADPTQHQHGTGRCEENWIDEDGRRRTRPAQGRIPKYVFSCKACQAEDAKRMAAPPVLKDDDDFDSTVFLVPENNTDARVVAEYLKQRYPDRQLFTTDTIRPERLALRRGAQVVVMGRRALPGKASVGPMYRQAEDKNGNVADIPVPPETYINEVFESAPVLVQDCVSSTDATMFADAVVDISELKAQLSDLAMPRNFIAEYKRVVGSDEVVFTLRSL